MSTRSAYGPEVTRRAQRVVVDIFAALGHRAENAVLIGGAAYGHRLSATTGRKWRTNGVRGAWYPRAGSPRPQSTLARASSSSPVSHSMIRSPMRAIASGSEMSSSNLESRSAVRAPNFSLACRRASPAPAGAASFRGSGSCTACRPGSGPGRGWSCSVARVSAAKPPRREALG